jgi:hypothetical protein
LGERRLIVKVLAREIQKQVAMGNAAIPRTGNADAGQRHVAVDGEVAGHTTLAKSEAVLFILPTSRRRTITERVDGVVPAVVKGARVGVRRTDCQSDKAAQQG